MPGRFSLGVSLPRILRRGWCPLVLSALECSSIGTALSDGIKDDQMQYKITRVSQSVYLPSWRCYQITPVTGVRGHHWNGLCYVEELGFMSLSRELAMSWCRPTGRCSSIGGPSFLLVFYWPHCSCGLPVKSGAPSQPKRPGSLGRLPFLSACFCMDLPSTIHGSATAWMKMPSILQGNAKKREWSVSTLETICPVCTASVRVSMLTFGGGSL